MSRRRALSALMGAFAALTLVAASVVPVAAAAASSSRPTVALAMSVSGTTATVTADINRGTQQIASCRYALDSAAAVSCGAGSAVGSKASRYTLRLTNQGEGSHSVTVTIVLTDRGTASKAAPFTIASTDRDGDGIPNATDNCPTVANPKQTNSYGSAKGDACEDTDGNGTFDVYEPNMCVSIDGVAILGPVGTASCDSTKSLTSSRNIAIADGDLAGAFAGDGNGNTATAIGPFSMASADQGDGNSATATGDSADAQADNGDHNAASASGDNALAQAGFGNDNTATASGDGSIADAIGNANTATATGAGKFAFANAAAGCTAINSTCP